MLQNSYYNEKVVLKNMQLPSYAVSTQSSQGKVKSMKTKSAVPEKTIKVPSTSMYKDNKIYKCPVCKGSLISLFMCGHILNILKPLRKIFWFSI